MKRARFSLLIAACTLLAAASHLAIADEESTATGSVRTVALEVMIVATTGGANDERALELSGPSEKIAERVRELEAKGELDVVDRIRLTTLENQKALVQFGRTASVVTGRNFGGGRGGAPFAAPVYERQSFGTIVQVVAKIDGDAVVADLNIEKSQLELRKGDDEPKPDAEVAPPATQTLSCQATVRIAGGSTVLVGGMQTRSDAEASQNLVLVSANILKPPAGADVGTRPAVPKKIVRIIHLKNAAADEAARVIGEVFADRLEQFKIAADARTNTIIVSAEMDRLEVIAALLAELDEAGRKP